MDIAIRPKLSRAEVEAVVRERLGGDIEFTGHEEYLDGFFNAAHGLRLADGRDLVVKIAPDRDLKLLRYEVDLMATEIEFFRRAAGAGFPMPKLWHGDPDGGVIIMDRLQGTSLPKARDEMTDAERIEFRRGLGAVSARTGAIAGDHFGYPRRDRHTWSDSWGESFLTIIDDVVADNRELGIELPRPAEEIGRLIASHRSLLDQVKDPVLVHFDLWDGNVFVDRTESGWRVEGFIDGERAIYADPLAELVSLQLVPPEDAEAVLDGFLGRELDDDEARRLCLYRMYLWLILLAETGVRGFDAEQNEHQFTWATECLIKDLAILDG